MPEETETTKTFPEYGAEPKKITAISALINTGLSVAFRKRRF
jgi:hypothetical protein